MSGYYEHKLAADSLQRVYELAPPRVQRYLDAEVEFITAQLSGNERVLDLGCGYGRTLPALAARAALVVGVDTSAASLALAHRRLASFRNVLLAQMDASRLAFAEGFFDLVTCVQNGICAFDVDRRALLRESLRVLRPGGRALFSSYAAGFWGPRLAWFERQAAAGLIGEIDHERSGEGVIVCRDGLRLPLLRPAEFAALVAGLEVAWQALEVDGSSQFYLLEKPV